MNKMDIEKYRQIIASNIEPLWRYKAFRIATYVTTIYLSTGLIRRLLHLIRRKWYNLPPGPVGAPFIGSFLGMADFRNFLPALATTYGPISLISIGVTNFVIIHDATIIRQAFKKPQFLNVRPMGNTSTPNLGDINGDEWRKRRQLLSASFIGNNQLQSVQLNDFIVNQCLKKYIYRNLEISKNNYLCRKDVQFISFATVHRVIFMNDWINLSPTDKVYQQVAELSYKQHNSLPLATIIQWLVGSGSIGKSWSIKAAPVEQYAQKLDDIIINKWIEGQDINPNGYLSVLLKPENKLKKIEISREIQVLFQAGVNAVALSIEQAILWAAKCGDAQQRVYKDLFGVYGENGFSLKSIQKCHDFRGFCYEVLRMTTSCNASIPRYVEDDGVVLGGYNIPKGYGIIGDYTSQNKNKNVWKNANEFDIDNHLDKNGKFVNRGDLFSFGIGRRNCPGQALAFKIIYCVLGNIMLNYKFEMVNPKEFEDIEGLYKGGPDPPETAVRVIKR